MIRTRKKERCRPYQSTKTFKRSLPRSNSTRRKYSDSRARFGCSRNSKRPGSRPSSFHTNRARKSSNRSTRKTKNCNNYIKRPVWHLHVASNRESQLPTYLESALRAVFLLLHLLADRLFDLLAVHPRGHDGDDNRDVFSGHVHHLHLFIQYTGKKIQMIK